tara:strand:- start:230 stop:565 length:336 start_codon:yes stop_codon:yes gene_type:complete
MKFVFIDSNKQIMAVQSSPQPPDETAWESVQGYTRVEVADSLPATRDHKLIDGALVVSVNPDQPVVTYQELRKAKYPSIGDQLDMQYHDAIDGTTTWSDAIAAIKTKYPKG